MKSRKQPISDVWSHNRMLEICHLSNIAMRLGRELNWDPVKREMVESHIPMRRAGDSEEMAGVVAFLCSDRSGWLSGAVMRGVDVEQRHRRLPHLGVENVAEAGDEVPAARDDDEVAR